jgi:Cu-Zn family superoxide dismutase
MTLLKKFSASLFLLLFAAGCAQQSQDQSMEQTQESTNTYTKAVAVVHATEGNDVSGTVTFENTEDGVRVKGQLQGLSSGKHGFHIHQYGDCSASDGTSAGGHYNPTGNNHGSPTQDNRHMGDMGNLTVSEDGMATIDYVDPKITLSGSNSIIGHGVIVHGGEDDFKSQPSGAAGPRVGCGVIGIANTEMESGSEM